MQIFLSEQASNDKILVIILSFYIVSIQLSSVWVHRVLFYTCKTLLLVLGKSVLVHCHKKPETTILESNSGFVVEVYVSALIPF